MHLVDGVLPSHLSGLSLRDNVAMLMGCCGNDGDKEEDDGSDMENIHGTSLLESNDDQPY